MGVVVSVVVLSAALVAAPAPVSAPSSTTPAAAASSSAPAIDPWPAIGAGAVLVGGATSTAAAVVGVGLQAVIDDPAAVGADRQRAIEQVPFAVGLVVAGAVVVVVGIGVIVWRTVFSAPPVEATP